ncbi:hypothetical protein BC938DRAFT_477250 [Jimgerdemannia flammicorona]|uniref:Uncharacterized protein n=1 Tax=Jimgerdemannia flammicorona TaxID=994334 RepID=A0A433QPM0_9FUNG|nr:hypothetical protein BC938DRAFT_477250 [Jimgerdemannia flammicorona]
MHKNMLSVYMLVIIRRLRANM